MSTTLTINDELLAKAMEYTGVKERATVIRMALESLVAREAGRRIAPRWLRSRRLGCTASTA